MQISVNKHSQFLTSFPLPFLAQLRSEGRQASTLKRLMQVGVHTNSPENVSECSPTASCRGQSELKLAENEHLHTVAVRYYADRIRPKTWTSVIVRILFAPPLILR